MTAGSGKLFRPSNVSPSEKVLFQLREITGRSPEQIRHAYEACSGDMKKAVEFLTENQSGDASEGSSQLNQYKDLSTSKETNQKEVIEISDDKDDDLAKAIELSLREAHGGFGLAVSEEDKEISKALEASLVDSRAGNKRKRGNIWMSFIDPENPYERKRKDGVPVGLKNIGSTCWFSAVIQSLFHIPKFRNLVLNCRLTQNIENIKEQPKLAFLAELQKLFILLLRSKRKYVDPARPIEILEDAVRKMGKENAGEQQDVSEFTHVLLDWLEDAFQSHHESAGGKNPIAELFYGRYSVNGCYYGKEVKSEETFGALPLHVRGHAHIYDGLDAAMENNEIKTGDEDAAGSSSQENWFTHLPPVLTFELSRFIFNQQLSKAEKIHDPFRIEPTIHLARYMEQNKGLTREKRRLVDRSKRKRRELVAKLEGYMQFGSGPKKSPIISTLDSTLEFIRKGLRQQPDDEEIPMAISPGSSPVSSTMQESVEGSSILATVEGIHGPSPKNMTAEEGNTMIDCLQRLKDEVLQESEALRDAIEFIDRELNHAYDEDVLMQVPYRLHAILVHEGQANGGHYWSYIFDAEKRIWRKFNDVTVSETTWDEVQRESVGGHRNATAYCLVYVNAQRSDLFETTSAEASSGFLNVERFLEVDNENFCKEIEDWDAKQRRIDTDKQDEDGFGDKENTPMVVDSARVSPKKPLSNEESLEEQLEAFFRNRLKMMTNHISQKSARDPDRRLEDMALYFFDSNAPESIVNRGLLELYTEDLSSQEPKDILLRKYAKQRLEKIRERTENEAEYMKWKSYYKAFLRCTSCFISGIEEYRNKRYREGLPYFIHAIEVNRKFFNTEDSPGHLDNNMLLYFRRNCLHHVNDDASTSFQSNSTDDFEAGCALMKELVIPSLASFSETSDRDDLLMWERLRERWCAFLGSPEIPDEKNEMLGEIIMGLVDSGIKMTIKEPSIAEPFLGADIFQKYSEILELMKKENFFPSH